MSSPSMGKNWVKCMRIETHRKWRKKEKSLKYERNDDHHREFIARALEQIMVKRHRKNSQENKTKLWSIFFSSFSKWTSRSRISLNKTQILRFFSQYFKSELSFVRDCHLMPIRQKSTTTSTKCDTLRGRWCWGSRNEGDEKTQKKQRRFFFISFANFVLWRIFDFYFFFFTSTLWIEKLNSQEFQLLGTDR